MKKDSKKYIFVALYSLIGTIISFGGYCGVDISIGFLFSQSLYSNVIISSIVVLFVILINGGGMKLYAMISFTLIFAIVSYLIKSLKIKHKYIFEYLSVIVLGVIRQVFITTNIYSVGVAVIAILSSYYFSRKIFNETFDVSYDADYVSICAVTFCAVLGLCEIKLFSTSLIFIAIPFLVFLSSVYLGREKGILLSIIISISSYIGMKEPSFAVAVLIFAITSYLFEGKQSKLSPIIFIVEFIVLRYVANMFSDYSLISLIFFAIGALSVYLVPNKTSNNVSLTAPLEQIVNETLKMTAKRLKELSDTYKDLSKTIQCEVKNENIPEKIIAECVRTCGYCKHKQNCKVLKNQKEYFEPLAILALSKGSINTLDIGDQVYSNCLYSERLINAVNTATAKCTAMSVRQKERAELNSSLRKIFMGLSDVLAFEAGGLDKNLRFDKKTELELYEELKLSGINAKEIYCIRNSFGVPTVKISMGGDEANLKSILKIVSKTCGMKMRLQKGNGKGVLTYIPKAEHDVSIGISQIAKGGEKKLSGDNFISEKMVDDSYIIAISDGMGTGKEANVSSERTVNAIEDLFKAGFSIDVICPLINSVLVASGNESFSATDIAVIDTLNMNVVIIKLGTPPTFVVKEKVVELSGNSLPVGILDEAIPQKQLIDLKKDDMLIMMSDGVYDVLKEKTAYYIEKNRGVSPQEMSDRLLNLAIENDGNEIKDDMTVISVKII